MNKSVMKFLGYSVIVLLSLVIGIVIGKGINNFKKQEEPVLKVEKIAVSQIFIPNGEEKTYYSSGDLSISNEELNKYVKIINSDEIKKKVKEKYSDVGNVELTTIDKSSVIKVIYVCGDNPEENCLEINEEYVSAFMDYLKRNNVDASILSKACISTRMVEE